MTLKQRDQKTLETLLSHDCFCTCCKEWSRK